jgi:hypothetical protein
MRLFLTQPNKCILEVFGFNRAINAKYSDRASLITA